MLKCENAREWRLYGYGYLIGVFLTLLQGRPLLLYTVQMFSGWLLIHVVRNIHRKLQLICIYCLQNSFDVINKGKWFILGLILSKINAFQLVLIQFFLHLSLTYITKRYLKYQNIHILLFHLRAIFSEPGSYRVFNVLITWPEPLIV